MIKITHYEVYTDHGRGWQLEDRFAIEQRQDAFNLAKELELDKIKVKIIKEVFDVQDNSYQETVEYVSNLSRKNKNEGLPSSYPGIKKPTNVRKKSRWRKSSSQPAAAAY